MTYYTRLGTETTPTTQTAKGRPAYVRKDSCMRCGGAGGWSGWPGFTCYRCGGTGKEQPKVVALYTAEELAKLNATAAKKAAKKEAEHKAKEAALAAEREFAWGAYYWANKGAVDNLRWHRGAHHVLEDMALRLDRMEQLSDKALDFGLGLLINKLAQTDQKAGSSYVGTVGERRLFTLTVEKMINLGQYTYGAPTTYLYLCRDTAGNRVVYKGSANLGGEGETTTVKATVKDHTEYNGELQTLIARPAKVEDKQPA